MKAIFSSSPHSIGAIAVRREFFRLDSDGNATVYPPVRLSAIVAAAMGALKTESEKAAGRTILSSMRVLLIVNSLLISPRKEVKKSFESFRFRSRLL